MIKKIALTLLVGLTLTICGIGAESLKKREYTSFNFQTAPRSQKDVRNSVCEENVGQIKKDVDQKNSGDNKKM